MKEIVAESIDFSPQSALLCASFIVFRSTSPLLDGAVALVFFRVGLSLSALSQYHLR